MLGYEIMQNVGRTECNNSRWHWMTVRRTFSGTRMTQRRTRISAKVKCTPVVHLCLHASSNLTCDYVDLANTLSDVEAELSETSVSHCSSTTTATRLW